LEPEGPGRKVVTFVAALLWACARLLRISAGIGERRCFCFAGMLKNRVRKGVEQEILLEWIARDRNAGLVLARLALEDKKQIRCIHSLERQ
jgi:hypothetical protein